MNSEALFFVLVGTTHSGNIGAAARAMKTMGFSQLRLVDCCSHRTADAIARASGANDVVEGATCFDTLDAAIADCHYVYGTSARVRHLSVPLVEAEEAAADIAAAICESSAVSSGSASADRANHNSRVALVFGRERSGLSNDELDRCTRLLHIPVNPDFSSLNLGSAVQVVAYELAKALGRQNQETLTNAAAEDLASLQGEQSSDRLAPANSETMALFFEHLDRALTTTGFLDPDNPRLLMRRLRGYFERNRPDMTEMSLLRGMLTASEKPQSRSPTNTSNEPPGEL